MVDFEKLKFGPQWMVSVAVNAVILTGMWVTMSVKLDVLNETVKGMKTDSQQKDSRQDTDITNLVIDQARQGSRITFLEQIINSKK